MRKKKRRFRYLLHKHIDRLLFHVRDEFNIESNKQYLELRNKSKGKGYEIMSEIDEFYQLVDELGLDEETLKLVVRKYYLRAKGVKGEYKKKPKRECKDNKKVINWGSGSPGHSTIRYPSKKRSRQTWKNFYNLFPHLAERDKWDGKTSNKMK